MLCCLIVIGLYLHYFCKYHLTCYFHGSYITSYDTPVPGHRGTVCGAKCHTEQSDTPHVVGGYLLGPWGHL